MVEVTSRHVVLSNATQVFSNPWLGLWLDASAAAGIDVQELTAASALRPGRNVLGAHLQWPEQVLRRTSRRVAGRGVVHLLVVCAALRLRGRRVLWTAHNVESHDRRHPLLERLLWLGLMPLVTDVHLMTDAGRAEVVRRHPASRRCRWHVIPHGDYPQDAQPPSRAEARARIGLPADGLVVMSIGLLRAYKGLTHLVTAFDALPDPDARLLLWGRAPDAEALAALTTAAEADPRVDLRPGYVSEDDLQEALAACDVVVLPYRRVLNSGSVLRALSAARRVLVPETATFAELGRRVNEGWVHQFAGELSAADLVRVGSDDAERKAPDLSWCSWSEVSRAIAALWGLPRAAPSPGNGPERATAAGAPVSRGTS